MALVDTGTDTCWYHELVDRAVSHETSRHSDKNTNVIFLSYSLYANQSLVAHTMSSLPPHLKNLLRQVNINANTDCVEVETKIKERAVQQLNHYLRVINTRLSSTDNSDDSSTKRIQTLLKFIHQHVT